MRSPLPLVFAAGGGLVIVALLYLLGPHGDNWRLNPWNWLIGPAQIAARRAPSNFPSPKEYPDQRALQSWSARVSLSDVLLRNAVSSLVRDGYDVILDESGRVIPHTAYVSLEKLLDISSTAKGSLLVRLDARAHLETWFSGNIGVKGLQIEFVPSMRSDAGKWAVVLMPTVTDVHFETPLTGDSGAKLDRFLAAALTTSMQKEPPVIALPESIASFPIELPAYNVRTWTMDEFKLAFKEGKLTLYGRLRDPSR